MRLAVVPGDGIGTEVVTEALKVLREVAPDIEHTHYDLGAARWQRTGELLPDTVTSVPSAMAPCTRIRLR